MGQLISDVTKVLDYKESKRNAENERQKILADIAADERTKNNLIKKVLAGQRAKYGASGNSGNSFSENAVLKRLRDETAEPYETKRQENIDKIIKTKVKKPNLLKNWLSSIDKIAG
ncbi:MAG: hypothetical protein IJL05_00220 [Alphaproteobacteria bacterium]|nr:hypothetical protein [Alphaproteobacteria bacterium]